MKKLIPILIGLLVVGCGKKEEVKPQTKSEQIPQFKKSTETKTSEPKQPDIKKLITDSF